jgi:hypothetical protein
MPGNIGQVPVRVVDAVARSGRAVRATGCPRARSDNAASFHSFPRATMSAPHRFVLSCLWLASMTAGAAAPDAGAPCQPRNLGFDQKEAGWAHLPLSKLKRDTAYTVVQDGSRTGVLRAGADRSASLFVARVKPALGTPMTLSWDWKTDALVEGADNRQKDREDAPLRVLVAFDGDVGTLPDAEQKRFSRAKSLAGRQPPYAVLMYVWTDQVPVGTVIPSAHTSQVKMLAVASGKSGLGAWQTVQRNVAEDYRRAYGAEPGPVVGVAVMTDTDNTGTQAVGQYAGMRIACPGQ